MYSEIIYFIYWKKDYFDNNSCNLQQNKGTYSIYIVFLWMH